ncbi:unnamed protein product [Rotaria socialis]|uniref:WD repeat-containing protein 75 second beta-propeller domain-containing protein n=1 Tax=Rotaria socialis TaxID=392032 RepID=A0A817MUE7_9BILA|nr:unnamed protein product [Rotaria socialis]CAF3205395.1 unnamed protein product [Rotaria socialis]CAF3564781.1 unnamed protein product [Rotaria socialis]CAF3783049.1 unnamed protein product [Rotaria socialis]CAF4245633.1 unnamed protein product [Rotaria socialis]
MKKLNIRQFGIGTIMKYRPIISSDSKYIFTIGDGCVYVWIVKTGECLRLINQTTNSNDQQTIVSIAINPNNRLQLCVGEQNGIINIWDYEDGILIHTIKVDLEIIDLYSITNNGLFVFSKNNKNVYSLYRIESIRHNCSPLIVFDKLPCLPTNISFDQKGELSIFINVDGTIIYLLNLINNQIKSLPITKKNLSYHDKVTCAQIHPNQECVALGTQSGRIALWYNFVNSTTKETTVSYLHWHSLPVICLTFSFDGSYLLSGGHECVLVKWFYRKSEPTFRPRLGSPIIHITSSNDQTFYVSTHSDNSLHLIGSNLSIQQTIAGINHMFLPQQASLPAGINIFIRQQALVMNSGKPGYLQFMSIENGKLIFNLDIVGENYVSPNDITEQCLFTDIKRLVIDPTDTWLVTFEERSSNSNSNTDDHQNERKLRFWMFNQITNEFELNTTILYPHGQETLSQMLFHPNKLELATTGNDGFLKIWNFIQQNPITKRVSHWRCLSGHTHRSYSSSALSYYKLSTSNEMNLCCSFEHLVTVWIDKINDLNEESRYEYSSCFAHFDRKNSVQFIIFNNDQILVCHKTLVNLWNCLNGQFIKSFSWHVHTYAKDPKSSFVALFDKSFLHFYSFSDGKCHSRKSSLFRRVTSASYIPNKKSSSFIPFQHSRLIFYIPEQGLKTFVDDDDDDDNDDENNLIQINQIKDKTNEEKTILANLIRQSQQFSQQDVIVKQKSFDDLTKLNRTINNLNQQFLTTPAYLLPSIDNYCIDSLKRMLLPNQYENKSETSLNDDISIDHLSTMSVDSQQDL